MTRTRLNLVAGAGRVGWAALVLCLTLPAALAAQTVPTFPQLPAPKSPAAPPVTAQTAPAPQPAAAPTAATGAQAKGPRDPFDPLVKPKPPEEKAAPQLAGLKLVGVMWDPKNRDQIRALIETPDGLGYYVRLNDEKFGGKVVGIERDRVKFSVREEVPGAGARERTVELKLGGQ